MLELEGTVRRPLKRCASVRGKKRASKSEPSIKGESFI